MKMDTRIGTRWRLWQVGLGMAGPSPAFWLALIFVLIIGSLSSHTVEAESKENSPSQPEHEDVDESFTCPDPNDVTEGGSLTVTLK